MNVCRPKMAGSFAVLAVLVFVACGGGGSGSGSASPCSTVVNEMCQGAVACSSPGEVVFVIGPDDAGQGAGYFEVNGGLSQCQGLVGLACQGTQAGQFTAACASVGAYMCGPSESHGNGLMVPGACWAAQ
jgi:hypothetical protein